MKPFTNCAVDFAGPFITIQGRGKSRVKRYLCLFVCLQTRCVHLEMAWSLETDGFLKALTRMVARRGWLRDMLSDNGTNFVGGNNELQGLVQHLDQDKIQRMTSNNGIRWHWNPPLTPHFGGVFERMIKAAKRAIYAIQYTLCIMHSSRSGPGNESSKQGRWLNRKLIIAILCSFSSEYNPKVFKMNFYQSDIPGAS